MKRICIVTTVWTSINNWIKPFLNEYRALGVDVTIVCNMDQEYERSLKEEFPFVHAKPIAFPRGINVFGSLKSIFALRKFFKENSFDMVQYSTPNASFYTALAAKSRKIPVRLYCQWGMIYVTQRGIKRKIFKWMERTICKKSTHIQPDSVGNLEFCRNEGFYDASKSCVIWNGSAKGIDLGAYDDSKKAEYAAEIKAMYGIAEDQTVIGSVSRLGREKGCHELFEAFRSIKKDFPKTKLLFVGPLEKEETMDPEMLAYFHSCEDIIKTGRVNRVERYVSAMDIFVLPSYREGFGLSVVEASAMRVPVVVTKYPGPSGAMQDGVTGLAVDVKDARGLEAAIRQLLENPDAAKRMGDEGRIFVEKNFEQKIFIQKYMENRKKLLGLE